MAAYYNENDSYCVQWLRNLISAGPSMQKWPRYRNLWPTPTHRDYRSGVNHNCWNNARPLSEVVGGLLNPLWVAWLMGYPAEWDACAPTAMPSSRKSRRPSSPQPQ